MPEKKSDTLQPLFISSFFENYPLEAARLLDSFPTADVLKYLGEMRIETAGDIFVQLNPEMAERLIPLMPDQFFQSLFTIIDPAHGAQLLSRVKKIDPSAAESKISQLGRQPAAEIRELMSYPPETAGYYMDPRAVIFHADDTVAMALERIRGVRRRRIVDLCIVDENKRLIGIVPLQNIAVAEYQEPLASLMQSNPPSVNAMASRDEVIELLDEGKLASLPVVDVHGDLLGIIRYDALVSAAQENASQNMQAMFGAGRDERALSKATFAIRKRLPWLEINLATAFLASAVVGMFEETIARITALAIFLPVVAGQSGNTGSQALAVTMRGLALREIRTRHWFQVARKEVAVGFVNGCAVALTTATIVYFWESSFGLALVIGVSMVISMVVAGLSGAVIPIILQLLGQDPAQSSSIILTTVTDVVGFLSFLGLATLLASALGIG